MTEARDPAAGGNPVPEPFQDPSRDPDAVHPGDPEWGWHPLVAVARKRRRLAGEAAEAAQRSAQTPQTAKPAPPAETALPVEAPEIKAISLPPPGTIPHRRRRRPLTVRSVCPEQTTAMASPRPRKTVMLPSARPRRT